MGSFPITVTVSHGGGSMADTLDEMLDDHDMERYVVHGPRACGPCRANENPNNVPCAECNGNVLRNDSDGPDGDADDVIGNLCQCRVAVRRKDDRNL